jgi:hypothetical protein
LVTALLPLLLRGINLLFVYCSCCCSAGAAAFVIGAAAQGCFGGCSHLAPPLAVALGALVLPTLAVSAAAIAATAAAAAAAVGV